MNTELLGKIKIVQAPDGEAPPEIKEKWVGVEMPCLFRDHTALGKGVISQAPLTCGATYFVLQQHAIDALKQVAPEAALW